MDSSAGNVFVHVLWYICVGISVEHIPRSGSAQL